MTRKRIALAQNFLKDEGLVAELVRDANISKDDVVFEIGPGEGIITRRLADIAQRVVAVEVDGALIRKLRERFAERNNVEIYQADYLNFAIRDQEYKVFSNIPFNITANVIKGLLARPNPPLTAYLIVQREAAMKYAGRPQETEISVLWKPWFNFEIRREVKREAFEPVPSVQPVFFAIERRKIPDVAAEHRPLYVKFIRHGFEAWKTSLRTAYKDVFTYEQWKRLSRDLGFPLKPVPTELSYAQWLDLFHFLLNRVPPSKWSKLSRRN